MVKCNPNCAFQANEQTLKVQDPVVNLSTRLHAQG